MIEKNVGIEILRILYKEDIQCPYGYEYSKCIDCPLYCETSITCDYGIDEEDDFEEYIEDIKLNPPLVLDCFECPFCDDINGCQFNINIPIIEGDNEIDDRFRLVVVIFLILEFTLVLLLLV